MFARSLLKVIFLSLVLSLANEVLPQLQAKGRVTREWVGVAVQQVTPELAQSFKRIIFAEEERGSRPEGQRAKPPIAERLGDPGSDRCGERGGS